MLPNQFPPSQCSSYFTQWLISEYLNRVNEQKSEDQSSPDHLQPPPPPPPKTPPPTPNHQNHHQPFSAKHLKHLFTQHTSKHHHSSSSSTHHSNNKPNNNEYKNGLSSSHHSSGSSSATSPSSPEASITHPKNIEFIQLLALNALEFTAPIYSFLNKKQQQQTSRESEPTTKKKNVEVVKPVKCPSTRTFVQLSGHPGSFAPAGPNTVWKKMPEDQGGAVCGRDQLAGNTLRVLLEGLTINGESTAPLHTGPQESTPSPSSSTDTTTPITVFFNSSESTTTTSTTSSSTSTSSTTSTTNPPLLPPQIFSIPTHLLPNETQVYRNVNSTSPPDSLIKIIPKYVTETCYCSQMFLELEDLLTNFSHSNPTIMDIKLGTRTFLESEVQNSKPRPDLYQKLISVDPSACTDQEHEEKAVTKLTYMLFREKQSSSNSLGFRVEGIKIGENGKYDPTTQLDDVNFKVLRNEDKITMVFKRFCKSSVEIAKKFLKRLEFIRDTLESSEFFLTHEVIGSSLLFIHDDDHVGIWLIDFAKTFEVPGNGRLTHRTLWKLGNREDGVLTGVDSTIRLFRRVVRELDER